MGSRRAASADVGDGRAPEHVSLGSSAIRRSGRAVACVQVQPDSLAVPARTQEADDQPPGDRRTRQHLQLRVRGVAVLLAVGQAPARPASAGRAARRARRPGSRSRCWRWRRGRCRPAGSTSPRSWPARRCGRRRVCSPRAAWSTARRRPPAPADRRCRSRPGSRAARSPAGSMSGADRCRWRHVVVIAAVLVVRPHEQRPRPGRRVEHGVHHRLDERLADLDVGRVLLVLVLGGGVVGRRRCRSGSRRRGRSRRR